MAEAWRRLDPNIKDIGAIVGEGHDDLLAEAERATLEAGVKLHPRTAKSDRETMYLFNRLVPEIDGFWLFPDNRILSPSVLRHLLTYGSRHKVQIAVFNPSMLELGATISSTSVESDVAATIVKVLKGLARGEGQSLPDVTPLTAIDVRTNVDVANREDSSAPQVPTAKRIARSP